MNTSRIESLGRDLILCLTVAAYQTLSTIINLPFNIIEKGLDLLAVRGRTLSERDRAAHRPADHRDVTNPAGDGQAEDQVAP